MRAQEQKFFASFFKKEDLPFYLRAVAATRITLR
jgi:hypothetical protein